MQKQSKIGRFDLIRILGEGSQGIVYLAKDPILERQVAIKTIRTSNGQKVMQKGSSLNALLMDEAKVISKMTHSNIVSIFEAGEEDNMVFLVFEYVKGKTLSDVIKSKKYKKIKDIFELFRPICLGMEHSHKNKIIHGDLKPANIVIDQNNTPKIMDFGIARLLSNQKSDQNLYGTPRYMPPEYLQKREVTQSNDVYALGLILYELLTGEVAVAGKELKEIVYNAFNKKIKSPSQCHPDVSEVFEHVVVKATEKVRKNRYQSVSEMLEAIDKISEKMNISNRSSKAQDAAITFLIRKIQRKQDFPALSETLLKINTLVDNDDSNVSQLSSVIVEDFALTNKILKLVNSAFYRGMQGEIKTISQAVLMLGFNEVRSIAMSLILIDHIHHKSKANKLKNHVVSSIYSGILAKDLSAEINLPEHEEAFLSGTFHQLGEMLCLFYFYEEADEIDKLISEEKLTKEQAAIKILGVTYHKLGVEIAKLWKLPQYIINNITPFKVDEINPKKALNNQQKLQAITSLSNELSDALEKKEDVKWRNNAVKIWKNYASTLNLKDDALKKIADKARKNLIEANHVFNINLQESEVLRKVNLLNTEEEQELSEDDKTLVISEQEQIDLTLALQEEDAKDAIEKAKLAPEKVLQNAIDDIEAEIAGKNQLGTIFNIVIDAIVSGFNLERLIICFYNNAEKKMIAKMGRGIADSFLASFNFSLRNATNLFQLSCIKGVDIYINDTNEFEKKNNLPPWYRQIIDAETFMIFPIRFRSKPFAMIYLDNNRKNELIFDQQCLKQIQILRNLCVKSIEVKSDKSKK